ncbi:hypothetical protein IC235_21760 [Hymenobacter sp. BT664]|uniref:SPOR domain-containing protein n=1 Tax=Hymenobacter montanus TaxID=2771359 RepID=A0A927BHU4_9BACT|nr:hypothetical protein [Hymenobacter montanus]MBD2770520.1 hypothetical protein [Hymenobacter montanus]
MSVQPSESEACRYYLNLVGKFRQDHCVGFFKSKNAADELQTIFQQRGMEVITDQIPYGGPSDPRYRVFVVGKNIFAARDLLGKVPLVDDE